MRRNIDRQINARQFFGWQIDGRIVAVIALTKPDDLWTDAERNEPQTYIGRLLVARDGHGKGCGAAVIEAVADEARQHGDKWLRHNCWSTSTRLHAYNKSLGFRHVRDRRRARTHERRAVRARPPHAHGASRVAPSPTRLEQDRSGWLNPAASC